MVPVRGGLIAGHPFPGNEVQQGIGNAVQKGVVHIVFYVVPPVVSLRKEQPGLTNNIPDMGFRNMAEIMRHLRHR